MKKTLKLAGLLLALVMVLSMMSVTAFAANDKTITITNPVDGQTYTAYKMLDVSTYVADDTTDVATNATYQVADGWEGFFTGDMLNYFEINEVTGEVTAKTEWSASDAEAIAKAALAYAKDEEISGTAAADVAGVLTISGLSEGYYVVDSSLGTLCALGTAADTVALTEKNTVPTVTKEVTAITERFSDAATDDTTTVAVGDVVSYTATITAKKGADGYVFHDVMDAGLTYNNDVAVTGLTVNTDYTVGQDTGDTFTITFTQTYLDSITADTTITITYTATVNENAIADTDEAGITNSATLDYGDENSTEATTASVKTFGFDVVKTDDSNNVITGAQFALYDAETGGNLIPLVKIADGSYRVATATEAGAAGFASAVIDAGEANIDGLGAGTYYLEETKQPDGYTMLDERVPVAITNADLDATVTSDVWTEGGIQVVNQAGQVLPETGGMGTTLLYIAGAILVIGAGVVLVSKKRMGAAK